MSQPLDPRAWQAMLEGFNVQIADDAHSANAITFDSREVNATTAFAALQGEKRHGNDFIAAALGAGAPFVLSDQDVPRAVKVSDATAALRGWARAWRDLSEATLIGVTGSAGKTTAKEFIAAAIGGGKTPGNLNTLNYLACYLLSHVAPHSRHVIEMGIDRIGEMDELTALIAPDIGVITNVGAAHLEFFGDLETIAFEKGRILTAPEQLVSSTVAWRYPGVPSYGFGEGATHRGTNLELTDSSAKFQFAGLEVEIASPSEKVAEAAVLALAIAERFNLPLEDAAKRLQSLEVPGGRMRLERGRYTLIDDTYNANPLSVTAALETLARQPGRRIAVLGDMRELGHDAPTYHREVGAAAAKAAQLLIAVGHHAGDYASGARDANLETLEFADTKAATVALLEHLEDHDTILVKGSKAVGLGAVAEVIRERL